MSENNNRSVNPQKATDTKLRIDPTTIPEPRSANSQPSSDCCELCGKQELSSWEVHQGYVLWYCDQCDLYQHGPRPGADSYRDQYHSGYEKNRERKVYSALTRLSYIRDLLPKGKSSVHALDVGCSIGASVEAAKRLNWHSVGVDVSQSAVDYCNRQGLKCYAYQGKRLPFEANSFDVITAWHVIEHVLDVTQTLKDWSRVLKPGGVIVLATPDGASPKVKKLGKAYKKFWAPEHTYTFNPKNLSQFAINLGLEAEPLKSRPNLKGLGWGMTCYEAVRRLNQKINEASGTQKEFCLVLRKPAEAAGTGKRSAA